MLRNVKLSIFILAGGIVICTLLVAYAVLMRSSLPPGSVYKYSLVSICIAFIFTVVLLKCSDETKGMVALFFLAIGTGTYLLEIILVLYNFTQDESRRMGLPVKNRKLEIVKDLRTQGIDAYPYVLPADIISTDGIEFNGTKIYPVGAISGKTTVFCIEEKIPVIYEADEYGFRNPPGQYKTNDISIALIGDSFAQGFCVQNGEDIAGQLRRNNLKTLNLGMSGSGPLIELAILSEFARPFKPKHVFWLYYEGNDMPNLSWEKSPTLKKYFDEGFTQNLVQRQVEVDSALIAYFKEKTASNVMLNERENDKFMSLKQYLINQIRQMIILQNLRIKLGLHKQCLFDIDPDFKKIMIEARNRVDGWNGEFHFVYLPAQERYTQNFCRKKMLKIQRQKILSLLSELNINVIDMTINFDSCSNPASLFLGHYNSKGYALVAQEIEAYLAGKANSGIQK